MESDRENILRWSNVPTGLADLAVGVSEYDIGEQVLPAPFYLPASLKLN
jgi:hypothetical protein